MSYTDRVHQELRDKLHSLTANAGTEDLQTTKSILEEYIEVIDGNLADICKNCNGDGEIDELIEYNGREVERTLICDVCKGTGRS
jgi:DnaJ-class molecular chaperone